MTLHKIWICLHGLELEVVAALASSGYSVANPDLRSCLAEGYNVLLDITSGLGFALCLLAAYSWYYYRPHFC
jgi:hypothetical protein